MTIRRASAAASICRSSTRSASPRPASSRRSAVSATAMTTPWPKPSTASTRPRSSIGGARGDPSKPSNTRHWNGSTGSTTSGCSSPSVTCRQPKPKTDITRCWTKLASPHNSNQTASGNPGAVHTEARPRTYSASNMLVGADFCDAFSLAPISVTLSRRVYRWQRSLCGVNQRNRRRTSCRFPARPMMEGTAPLRRRGHR